MMRKLRYVVPPLGGRPAKARTRSRLKAELHTCSGFTLVELIVVLAIITVLVSISIPTIASLTSPKETLRKEGRRVMKLMNEARATAMNRKVRIDVRIDPVMNEIRAVESDAYRAFMAKYPDGRIDRDDEEWALAMTNRFEKTIAFSDEIILEGFSIDQIEVPLDEDDVFQALDVPEPAFPMEDDEPAEVLALTFTHFGGSDGGGIGLVYRETTLNIAADILTGRPRLVNRIGGADE